MFSRRNWTALIDGIDSDEAKLNVVRFVTDMAQKLGLKPVIAEFVDSAEKIQLLSDLPSEFLYQGFYFSKPLSIDKLLERFA